MGLGMETGQDAVQAGWKADEDDNGMRMGMRRDEMRWTWGWDGKKLEMGIGWEGGGMGIGMEVRC